MNYYDEFENEFYNPDDDEAKPGANLNWKKIQRGFKRVAGATLVQDWSLTYEKLVKGTLGFVTPQMFGAKGDGTTDDTEAIQAALNASEMLFIPDGTYMVNAIMSHFASDNGGLLVPSNKVIVMSDDAVIKAIPNNSPYYAVFHIRNASNIRIIGGAIAGERGSHTYTSGSTHEWGYAVYIRGESASVYIENVDIYDFTGDGVMVSKVTNEEDIPEDISIKNCRIYNNNRQGISVTDCHHFEISGNVIYNISGTAPQDGIDLEPNNFDDKRIQYGIIKDNYIYNCGGFCVQLYYCHDISVSDNIFKNAKVIEPSSPYRTKDNTAITINGNRIICTAQTRAYFLMSSELDVYDNYFDNIAILFYRPEKTTLKNQDFHDNMCNNSVVYPTTGGGYTCTCINVKFRNNKFIVDCTGQTSASTRFTFGSRDRYAGFIFNGLIVRDNTFIFTNTDQLPVATGVNDASFTIDINNGEFCGNYIKDCPNAILIPTAINFKFDNNYIDGLNVGPVDSVIPYLLNFNKIDTDEGLTSICNNIFKLTTDSKIANFNALLFCPNSVIMGNLIFSATEKTLTGGAFYINNAKNVYFVGNMAKNISPLYKFDITDDTTKVF